jgi:hypothetical protein
MESWHNMTDHASLGFVDLTIFPYTTLVSLPSGVCPLMTMTDEEVNYRDCGCRIT